ncbi:MAG TPA: TVP38/TMEM64 family protein [Spirochaetia bacterium]|nr:TVP38/TMEM64 family protein [Spirochaetia bacterium]
MAEKPSKNRMWGVITLSVVTLGCIVLLVLFKDELWDLANNPERITAWVEGFGLWGPIAFIGLQIIQVVIFIIPGEIPQIAGGMLFGVAGGIIYSTLGIAVGSTVNFYLARTFKLSFVETLFSRESVEKMQRFISSSRTVVVYFFLFLIPGIPKDIIAYVAGLSRIRFRLFILVSSVGRLPGLLLSVLAGSALSEKNLLAAGILLAVGLAMVALGFVFRGKIIRFIEHHFFTAEETSPKNRGN